MHPNLSVYKPDWQEARQRLIDWWAGRPVDRVPALVHAPLQPARPRITSACNQAPAMYTDPETVFRNLEYQLERTFWGGEHFPTHFVYLGPMFCLAFLGCEPNFTPETTWYEPCLQDWTDLPRIRFDPDNRWLQLNRELMRLSLERAEGRWLVSESAQLGALIDTLCGLLGNGKTLLAMAEHPEAIRAARDRMIPWMRQTYDEGYALLSQRQEGVTNWMYIWMPGRGVTSQCDMSVMISPAMFRDFVVPELAALYQHVDCGIYHLDGPEEIRHLDELLKIEKLHLIQWVPGVRIRSNHGDPMNWLDLFKRIQAAGKKVLIRCPPARVRPLLDKIARDRVFLDVGCRDETTARQVLRELEQIGA